MAVYEVGGSFGTVFNWTGTYNDSGRGTVTLEATGEGRAVALCQQEDGRQAAVYFNQPGGGERVALPPGTDVAVEVDVVVGSGPQVISPARLDAFPPTSDKPGDIGGFVVHTYYQRF